MVKQEYKGLYTLQSVPSDTELQKNERKRLGIRFMRRNRDIACGHIELAINTLNQREYVISDKRNVSDKWRNARLTA